MAVEQAAASLQLTVGADARITKSGKWLRKYKIDELPQLIDVFAGTMSMVGPRPEVPKYIAAYPDDLRTVILSVKPGITDRASLEFRDENALLAQASDPEKEYIEKILPIKQKYYVQYVKQRSLWFDIKIIFQTLYLVFMRNSAPAKAE
jgi:lipopolysaccharide/colanic/teichoic acid biosynthesis glycosyltransferase